MKKILKSLRDVFTSLRLTVLLIAMSMLLIFAATIDQVNLGVWAVQEKYFRSFFVWMPLGARSLPVFPGGYLIGGAFALNLAAAFAARFQFSLKKSGILLAHAGLVLLLVGELLSGVWQQDDQMALNEGQTKDYAESFRKTELYVSDITDADYADVVAIPSTLLAKQKPIQYPTLPFRVEPLRYYENAAVFQKTTPAVEGDTMQGLGANLSVSPMAVTYRPNEQNEPAAFVNLVGSDGLIGTWIVALVLQQPQQFDYAGRTWEIGLRATRDYKPFSLTLLDFTHDRYPGTDIPKNFSSRLRLTTPDGIEDREVLIYMNNPLRYGGYTFYQSGFTNDDLTTILQVVKNPSWLIPYVACGMMTAGLAVQFLIHLAGFARRRRKLSAS